MEELVEKSAEEERSLRLWEEGSEEGDEVASEGEEEEARSNQHRLIRTPSLECLPSSIKEEDEKKQAGEEDEEEEDLRYYRRSIGSSSVRLPFRECQRQPLA